MAGEQWGEHKSPRANRYIAIADKYNPTISSLETFSSQHVEFDADLYVVGGLQVMDNFNFKFVIISDICVYSCNV